MPKSLKGSYLEVSFINGKCVNTVVHRCDRHNIKEMRRSFRKHFSVASRILKIVRVTPQSAGNIMLIESMRGIY